MSELIIVDKGSRVDHPAYEVALLVLPIEVDSTLTTFAITAATRSLLSSALLSLRQRLYINLELTATHWASLSSVTCDKLLSDIYRHAFNVSPHIDVRVLLPSPSLPLSTADHTVSVRIPADVQIVFRSRHDDVKKFVVDSRDAKITFPTSTITVGTEKEDAPELSPPVDTEFASSSSAPSSSTASSAAKPSALTAEQANTSIAAHLNQYENVVVGGTFDRIHLGHKILLTVTAFCASKSVTVGVTDDSLLTKKYLTDLVAPTTQRINDVTEFLTSIRPALTYHVVSISTPEGPTVTESNYQALVVSLETEVGGRSINTQRQALSFPLMQLVAVGLLPSSVVTEKMSSSASRLADLGRYLGRFHPYPWARKIDNQPYIIAVTGGIASGKSSISKYLAEHYNVKYVDCDLLGHASYTKTGLAYPLLIQHFGEDILDANKEIDRKKLGGIVFHPTTGKDSLLKLNSIVWPVIQQLVEEKLKEFNKDDIVVIEAAVLLQAKWDFMNEAWVCFVPRHEAISRIMTRNSLTEADATSRVNAQESNQFRIERADVLLSTMFEKEKTQAIVREAWTKILERRELWKVNEAGTSVKDHFLSLLSDVKADATIMNKWWSTIEAAYTESHRAYHSMSHLTALLRQYDEQYAYMYDPVFVKLCIFFHDVVYRTEKKGLTSHSNEKHSAELFEQFASEVKLDAKLTSLVVDTILITEQHTALRALTFDQALFLDIDLSILGSSPSEYEAYAAGVRKEYSHVEASAFAAGRTKILQSIIAHPQYLFRTAQFRRLIPAALKNIQNEIAALNAK